MKVWLIRHPRILGVLFAVGAILAFKEGVDSAKEQRRFAGATAITAEVVSVTKKSTLPPRWNADVSWRERGLARTARIVVGTGKGWSDPAVSPGQDVEILIAQGDAESAVLARRMTNATTTSLAGMQLDSDEFWFAVLFAGAALLVFLFAGRIAREAGEYFGS